MYDPGTARWMSRDLLGIEADGGADGIGGVNLYLYAMSNPVVMVDPSGLESFYVCSRDPLGGGAPEATARTCGCSHTDIYGDQSGQIRVGFGGGVGGGGGGGLPQGPGWNCRKLSKKEYDTYYIGQFPHLREKFMKYGPGAGKSCKNVTSSEIAGCLAAVPKPPGQPGWPQALVTNCQTDVYNAAEQCCLAGPPPLTLLPPGPRPRPIP